MPFMKLEAGDPAYLVDFPQQCICGAQKGPMVTTGINPPNYGHIYLCRLCVTQAARALGMVKGDEMIRLQSAADELAQATREIGERQELIDRYVKSMGENETKLAQQAGYIESLRGEISTFKSQASQVLATAREMAAA